MKLFLRQALQTLRAEAKLATQAATGKHGRTTWLTSTILLVTLVALLASASTANAASRYAVQNGNWNSTTVWSTASGGSSGASVPVAGDDVFIAEGLNGRTVTIPTGYSAACTSLAMGNEAAAVAGTLNFSSSTSSLVVSGNVVMNRPGGAVTTTISLAAGSMTVGGNLELAHHEASSPANSRINRIKVSTGTLSISGDLIFGAEAAAQSQIVFSSTGRMNLAGAFALSNSLGTLIPSTGTDNFNGTAAQTIAGTLALDSSAVVSLDSGSSYTAHALPIGGMLKVAGSWGNTGSGAASIDPTHFADTDVLNISTGAAADAAHSVVSPASASITANGTSTRVITVQARDINKNLTTGGSTVVISKSSGTGSLGGTTNNGKGTYIATAASPTIAGSGSFTATTEWGLSMMTVLFVGVALWDSIRSRKSRRQSPFQPKRDRGYR